MPSPGRRKALPAVGAVVALAALSAVVRYADREPRADAGLFSQVLLSADGRTLTTPVMWAPCQEAEPRLFARETPQTVAADLKTGRTVDQTHECPSAGRLVSLTLHASLGTRQLSEANTGKPFVPFPAARLADVGYLPPGFTAISDVPQVFGSVAGPWTPNPYNRSDTVPSWTRYYATVGKPALSITQNLPAAGTHDPAPGTHAGPPMSVNGHSASLVCDTDSERALTWSDGVSTFTVVSIDPHHAALSPSELLRVANGLRNP
ncbi:hypothetical protein ACIG0C_36645 [Kitasatospora aureofaciens]|uniref:Uncharacterized protein n=1 Tax=Kitasatospora aureofaciens TaxID=1894 RepID=A0A1E7N1P4_KITAU|nr:hypothetical protein [Kitasatospora aureofaciens]QEV03550.1 hypothetical protein CP971_33975 [Streptomyces viridifaciens]ARF82032.1 hypothetical protein B6264_26925 [Kitasatospora aureofaciens]OEV34602.1 hypothetical protein HS99_0008865 [Kitasatospora aureofaciens]UKZ03783.1 hypothetical protein BOQ63_006805 [Streptomyces viridifaciens]GGV07039.1 hypothetical protein GCM10010502_72750 [Kitasatospora aureofaciens]